MNRRHSQLFALAILIGTPLLISMATNAGSTPQDGTPPPASTPDAEQLAADPSQPMPQPLAPPSPNQPGQAVVLGSTAPTLDTSGKAIAVTDPVGVNVSGASDAAAPAAAAPVMNLPSADVAAAPPAEAQAIAQQPAAPIGS
ncbi:MAG: hypothetical protein J7494_07110 [Sphingobium sp.]|nr:hypothetical protein [Sphingobium sp.]